MANIKDDISVHNAQSYMDVANDMFFHKTGVFTFTLRVDGKKIVDYVPYESFDYKDIILYGKSTS